MQHTDLLVCDTDAQVPMELVLHCLMMCLVMRLLLLLQIGESSCVCDVQWPRNWHSSLHLLLPSQQCCSCPPAALVRLSRHQNAGKTLQCQSTSLTYIALVTARNNVQHDMLALVTGSTFVILKSEPTAACCHPANTAHSQLHLPRLYDFINIFGSAMCILDRYGPRFNGTIAVPSPMYCVNSTKTALTFPIFLLTKIQSYKQTQAIIISTSPATNKLLCCSCLSVVSFNSTIHLAQSSIICYFGFR